MTEKRPLDTVAVGALARIFETVGLSLFLTWCREPFPLNKRPLTYDRGYPHECFRLDSSRKLVVVLKEKDILVNQRCGFGEWKAGILYT